MHGEAYCAACHQLDEEFREAERLRKAPRVLESDAPMLYCDCCENYFGDSHELLDDHDRHERTLPTHAWAAEPTDFRMNADDLLERELEEQGFAEGSEYEREAIDALQAVLDHWCKRFGKQAFSATNNLVDLTEAAKKYRAENPLDAPPLAVSSGTK